MQNHRVNWSQAKLCSILAPCGSVLCLFICDRVLAGISCIGCLDFIFGLSDRGQNLLKDVVLRII